MKLLTISIASYNAASTLRKCLNSMVNSKYINELEIIVVNDGSKDDTLAIGKEYEKNYPYSVLVLDKTNGGHGSTINVAISISSAKYFKIVDADDWVETKNLDLLIEKMKKGVDVDLFVNPYYEVNALTGIKTQKNVFNKNIKSNYIYELNDCVLDMTLAMHAMTIRTSILKDMNLFIDENCFYVDMEYVLFPLPYIKNVIFLENPVYNYLLGTTTQSMNLDVFIKRRKQHEKVLDRLYSYYEGLDKKGSNYAEAIKNRIISATYIQYRILLLLSPFEGIVEYMSFDKKVPETIFDGISGNTKKIIKFFRVTRYKGYRIIVSILQLFHVITKDNQIL